jgi:hypothetical protein
VTSGSHVHVGPLESMFGVAAVEILKVRESGHLLFFGAKDAIEPVAA